MSSPAHDSLTIAAISTPPGAGGIGIIRISGSASLTILQTIFTPANPPCPLDSHRLYYGTITDPAQTKLLDEVLVVYMQAPKTYTREDVVEIHCHGGFLVLQSVLELILAHGAKLAEPGEFTKRAFLNGRIDLTRAEAVIDILSARTRKGVDLALEQMSGSLYKAVDRLRASLVEIRALLETAIDFPEEEIEIADHQALGARLQDEVLIPLKKLIIQADSGRIVREGVAIVIIGRPNVGKSSLLNTLLQEERALVTSVPGTTRDTIEEYIDIHGIPVRIIDTAGIREDVEEVEELGIRRARESLNRADLVLFLVDGSEPIDNDDISLFETVKHKPLITVINKCDLEQRFDRQTHQQIVVEAVEISAREQTGLEQLKEKIFHRITGDREQWQEEGCTPNLRHKAALENGLRALNRVAEGLTDGLHNDLIMVDLLECLDHLGEIVGETTTEDVLDVIFEQFCLGK
ncbi:MAG: tRNA uridine-5-carboxymethylaminomethyl(34) synthesis GTPase MnmE [Desulfofustis sp.]|nr:tRNA uridine-5-carboxymethylaminomethyl(34) synthesis GTPase MnmE [Desulfofustis sp.]NNF46996.1 tRNA uridine-5-carboxymethylaminomethyl(34) synthesis GTPase MnmE [Desulfofustis sp.]NNK56107.1 tRNA uridine-5-carboxymethylaminomethyl(34) synthesis GTPase MnmE [Desulfofustis sp.]